MPGGGGEAISDEAIGLVGLNSLSYKRPIARMFKMFMEGVSFLMWGIFDICRDLMTSESARGNGDTPHFSGEIPIGNAGFCPTRCTCCLGAVPDMKGTLAEMSSHSVVDSHIHLYPRTELSSLAWCKEGHPLHGQYSIKEYLEATDDLCKASNQKLRGFVFVETDRKSSLESEVGWEEPLRELDWIKRIADGTPRTGEGHEPQHANLCLGIVLWAPLPLGSEAVSRYLGRAKDRAGSTWQLVKGLRYLVQNKPPGTMLSDKFIDALRWMGRNGLAFDLGVDVRSGGLWQLTEAIEMIRRAHQGLPEQEKVTVVTSKHQSDATLNCAILSPHQLQTTCVNRICVVEI